MSNRHLLAPCALWLSLWTLRPPAAGNGFVVAFDPLDGSSIVDTNFSVGTIFGVWPGDKVTGITGRDQVRWGIGVACCAALAARSAASPAATRSDQRMWEGLGCAGCRGGAKLQGCQARTNAQQVSCLLASLFLLSYSLSRTLPQLRAGRRRHGHLRPPHRVLHRPQGRPRLPRVPAAGPASCSFIIIISVSAA